MRVQVYWNSHTHNFSVRNASTGIVFTHKNHITLGGAVFHVNKGGRQRVLTTGHKNVHAWVEGDWLPTENPSGVRVTYHPRSHGYFYRIDTEQAVTYADIVTLTTKGVWALNPKG